MKFYLEIRPSCFLDLLEHFSFYLSSETLDCLADLGSLGLREEEVPAVMRAFLDSGKRISWHSLGGEMLDRFITLCERIFTTDEIERNILQPLLTELRRIEKEGNWTWIARRKEDLNQKSNWALRLGFQQIADDIKAIFLKSDSIMDEGAN
jgi:hypothetical protein